MLSWKYESYSESKYRLRISLANPQRLSLCTCAVTSSINWEATDAISWNSCYVYVCFCVLNIFETIEGAADCEIRSVIRFLKARKVLPSEIHHQTFQVYGDNAISDGMAIKWVRMFNEGWENMHDEARSGRPSLVQADDFNKEDHAHRILGQTRCPLGRIFAPRHNNKLCCLLWNAEEAEACNSKQKARNAECHHSFASR